jgi:hypothetical protein
VQINHIPSNRKSIFDTLQSPSYHGPTFVRVEAEVVDSKLRILRSAHIPYRRLRNQAIWARVAPVLLDRSNSSSRGGLVLYRSSKSVPDSLFRIIRRVCKECGEKAPLNTIAAHDHDPMLHRENKLLVAQYNLPLGVEDLSRTLLEEIRWNGFAVVPSTECVLEIIRQLYGIQSVERSVQDVVDRLTLSR